MLADRIILPHWLVPVEPAGEELAPHAVALCEDKIFAVVAAEEAIARWPDAQRIALPDHVLIPGLINAHTHTPMSLLRGYAEDIPLQTWLHDRIWPVESQFADQGFVRDGTELALLEMLRGGITCFNDFYFYPDVAAEVACSAG